MLAKLLLIMDEELEDYSVLALVEEEEFLILDLQAAYWNIII